MKRKMFTFSGRLLLAGALVIGIAEESHAKKFFGSETNWEGCQYAYDGICQRFGIQTTYVFGIITNQQMVFESGPCDQICPN